MADTFQVTAIGHITAGRAEPIDDDWDSIPSSVVLDLKPVMEGFLPRSDVRKPDWATQIIKSYW